MGNFKKDTFENIIDDYLDHGEESVLYKYLREGRLKEKCDKADADARDKLIKKAALDLMYNVGYSIPGRVFDRRKAYLEEGSWNGTLTEKEKKEYLDKFDGKKYNGKKTRKKSKDGTNTGKKNSNKENGAIGRGNNTLLDLLNRWYMDRDYSWAGTQVTKSSVQGPTLEECQNLFEILSASKECENVAVPLRIDPMVGGGVYIVGKKVYGYRGDLFPYSNNYHCGLGILCPEKTEYGLEMTLDQGADNGFPDVSEAFKFFENDDTGMVTLREDFNGKASVPEDIPEVFASYFGTRRRNRIDAELEEGIEEEIEKNKQWFTKKEL